VEVPEEEAGRLGAMREDVQASLAALVSRAETA
jgi:hypothetical protein